MKVFILLEGQDYEPYNVIGVYSTKKRAENAEKRHATTRPKVELRFRNYIIKEHSVNSRKF